MGDNETISGCGCHACQKVIEMNNKWMWWNHIEDIGEDQLFEVTCGEENFICLVPKELANED